MADLTITKGPRGLFFVTDGEKNVSKGYKDESEANEALAAILAGGATATDEEAGEGDDDVLAGDDAAPTASPLQAVENDLSDLDEQIERLRQERDAKQAERDRIITETGASENTPFPTLLQEFFAAQDRERMARVDAVSAAKAALGVASGAGVSPADQARLAPARPAPRKPAGR